MEELSGFFPVEGSTEVANSVVQTGAQDGSVG